MTIVKLTISRRLHIMKSLVRVIIKYWNMLYLPNCFYFVFLVDLKQYAD